MISKIVELARALALLFFSSFSLLNIIANVNALIGPCITRRQRFMLRYLVDLLSAFAANIPANVVELWEETDAPNQVDEY